MKRAEINPKGVVLDYTIPLPLEKNRTSTREVLCINKDGSGGWIRTNDLRVMSLANSVKRYYFTFKTVKLCL